MTVSANLLRHETSPYLQQHADNPVHWRPWGPAALAEAAAANKPILLSVGYAACHWCHVMAHESFENPETAALMNRLFVNIKVDREERPDIDHLYMNALHALGEQGGWPLTMFLSPDGVPFWGGTYFPPTPRWGRPSFRQVLEGLAAAWKEGDRGIARNGAAITRSLAAAAATRPGEPIADVALDAAAAALLRMTDPVEGGLQGAPKFPNPPIFRFLWQNACRTGEPAGTAALHLMLERMSQGGIYDHLGGGFARYATDAVWLVPHFEKMLYDNAQLLDLLALTHAAAPSALFAERADGVVGWMLRDMAAEKDADGNSAFAASEDADSEGEEGRFYVWNAAEIDALLGADAVLFRNHYDIRAEGNWEGRVILRCMRAPATEMEARRLAHCRAVLFAARAARPRPARDDKVLADWNGLAIAALCRAAAVFGRPEWRLAARSAFAFVMAHLRAPDGRVQHAWRGGRIGAAGLLEDQAAMAQAALALFQAEGDPADLVTAIRLADLAQAWFADADGSFFTTASDATDIPLGLATRPRSAGDQAVPSGNGMMADVLARLFHITGEPIWRDRAEAVLRAFSGAAQALPAMPGLLTAADLLENGTAVVVAGDPANPAAAALLAAALAAPDPAVSVLRAIGPPMFSTAHPAHGIGPGAEPAAFVCRHGACSLPVRTVPDLQRLLRPSPALEAGPTHPAP